MSTYYIEKRQTLLADNTAHKGWYSRWYSSVKGQFSIRPKRIFSTLASKQLVPPSAKRSLDSIYGSAYPWLEINQRSDDMNIHIMGLNGQKKDINKQQFEQYTTSIRGDVLLPETAGYAEARTIWNGMIDISPSVIVRCSGAADVVTTIQFARKYELLISLKGGGHNIAGSALCNGGITLDLSSMKGISVDPSARIARVQSGVCLGDIDHETQRFGLAVPTGINSTTGIAGLALGGGYGWLSRAFGHTVDNIISADLVDAQGEFLHVSEQENSELFWAIRGGSGNFGVITQFEFKLHPVGPTVFGGPVVFPLSQAKSILRKYRELAKSMPDKASCWPVMRKAPPFPFLPPEHHGKPVIILPMIYVGDTAKGEEILAPLRTIAEPLADAVGPLPYASWQAAFDPLLAPGARNYWKSSDFTEMTDELIDTLVCAAEQLPSDECEIFTAQLGGAASRVAPDAMAFPHRSTAYTVNIHGRWQTAEMDEEGKGWVKGLFAQLETFSTGSVYVNFVPEYDEERSIGPYGANRPKLEDIKSRVDKLNLFRSNINILPKG